METTRHLPLAAADAGILEFEANGRTHIAVSVVLTVMDGSEPNVLPAAVMSASEARALALQLLDCADRAMAPGGTPLAN